MNLKIGEAVWYVEQCCNAYPTINIGKLIDLQNDKAIMLLGRQDYGIEEKYYEDIIWSNPIIDTYAFNDYEAAKTKLDLLIKDYKFKLEIKKNKAKEAGHDE